MAIGVVGSVRVTASTGCSSMAFGATLVCPWRSSKNPTPVIVTDAKHGLNVDVDGWPHMPTMASLAIAIAGRRVDELAPEHVTSGNSAIIVTLRSAGSAMTMW